MFLGACSEVLGRAGSGVVLLDWYLQGKLSIVKPEKAIYSSTLILFVLQPA